MERLVKCYGTFTAVDGISLQVREGEFFGFLGPNGAGKTTTINAILGSRTRAAAGLPFSATITSATGAARDASWDCRRRSTTSIGISRCATC
ncbi:MAG: ATP-binding cassette domain-containing protein [Candidatus Eremiobacteraeota bacterium]|nr:ATP-binding cassette domain-containing protein [Candidatus Eremiobacteraeota bacterium]